MDPHVAFATLGCLGIAPNRASSKLDVSLKVCIGEVRKALGDDSRASRFIETVHRRGYRFVGRLTAADEVRGSDRSPVVGRECELGRLGDQFGRALEGERQVTLVSGPAGVGLSPSPIWGIVRSL